MALVVPSFYKLVDDYGLFFATGQASNAVLKRKVERCERAVKHLYVDQNIKHQHFTAFRYQSKSWHKPQQVYTKIESTGKGLTVRHFISNIEEQKAREIYFDFYVKRGDTSENRIKELENMCFLDRLSNHGFLANFFRLFLSSLAYEMFLLLKKSIKKTTFEKVKKRQISNLRAHLLKIGATIRITRNEFTISYQKHLFIKNCFER